MVMVMRLGWLDYVIGTFITSKKEWADPYFTSPPPKLGLYSFIFLC